MHNSNKDSGTFNDNLNEFDDDLEFDDDFGFEEDWDDDEDLGQNPTNKEHILDEHTPPTNLEENTSRSEDTNLDTNLSSASACEEKSNESTKFYHQKTEQKSSFERNMAPESTVKKKKKRPFILLVTILIIILAIGLTAYNTLRPSLAPTFLPIIKLASSPDEQNDNNLIDDAQKRIDEILENTKEKKSLATNEDLMRPFEEESNVPDQNSLQTISAAEENLDIISVLTPLPSDLEEGKIELPPLDIALEQVHLDKEETIALELFDDTELVNDEIVQDPFSSNDSLSNESLEENSLPELVSEDAPNVNEITIVDSTKTQDLSIIDSDLRSENQSDPDNLALENAKAMAEAQAKEEKAKKEAQARMEAEAKEKAKIEAEKRAKEEIARKTAQAAKTAKEKAPVIQKQKTVKVTPAPKWEIRGIQPGRAVLYDKVSGDIEAVEPGNNIRGLGRIKGISKKYGRWVVFGTKGNVNQ